MNPLVKLFYMIRHGETVANAARFAAGALDTPLTELGRQQAREQREVFEALAPCPMRIVHSNLSRAVDTASLLNEGLNLPMSSNSLLAEQDYGDWARRPWSEVLPHLQARDTPPNGESHADFVARVMEGLTQVLADPDGPVLIVTHGGVFDAFIASYGYQIADVQNCHLYTFEPDSTEQTHFPWQIWHNQPPLTKGAPPVRTPVLLSPRLA